VIRRLLRELADRALVGPRPVVSRETRPAGPRWTESAAPTPPRAAPDLTDGLEVEAPVPGSLLLDIREPGELASGVAAGALLLPMDLVPHHLDRLPRDRPITVYCAAGARSWGVAHWLREQGFPGAVSLAGGLSAVPGPREVPERAGERIRLPAGLEAGAYAPAQDAEIIAPDGDAWRCRVRDPQGFWVERRAPRG